MSLNGRRWSRPGSPPSPSRHTISGSPPCNTCWQGSRATPANPASRCLPAPSSRADPRPPPEAKRSTLSAGVLISINEPGPEQRKVSVVKPVTSTVAERINPMINRDVVTFGEAMALLVAQTTGDLAHSKLSPRRMAGCETNVAVGLARLGLRVGWVSRLGHDPMGRFIRKTLETEGVDCSHGTIDPP